MNAMNQSIILIKVKRDDLEYTCKFKTGASILENWHSMTLIEPNLSKLKVKFNPTIIEPRIDISKIDKSHSFEDSFINLTKYHEIETITSLWPILLSIGNFEEAKYLVVPDLVASNQENILSFNDFMLLCAAQCYLTVERKYFSSNSYHSVSVSEVNTILNNCYINPLASKYGIPIDESIHWLIVPEFERLFHLYPCEIMALAAYLSIKSDLTTSFKEDFGTNKKIKMKLIDISRKYNFRDRNIFETCQAQLAHHYAVLKEYLPLKNIDSNDIESHYCDFKLLEYIEEIENADEVVCEPKNITDDTESTQQGELVILLVVFKMITIVTFMMIELIFKFIKFIY